MSTEIDYKDKYPHLPLTGEIERIRFNESDRTALVGNVGLEKPILPGRDSSTLTFDTEDGATSANLYFLTAKDGQILSSVLKTSYVEEEFSGREEVADYLKIPQSRIICDKNNNKYLILPYIDAPTVNYLLGQDDSRGVEALKKLTKDLEKMWKDTREPFDKTRLARDYTEHTAKSITRITEAAAEKLFGSNSDALDLPFYVDGVEIGKPRQLMEQMRKSVLESPESMILTHGDEIAENVLAVIGTDGVDYRILDPRLAGYYDLAWILGSQFYPRFYVLNTSYGSNFEVNIQDDRVDVNNFTRIQTNATAEAKEHSLDFIRKAIDNPNDFSRVAAFAFNDIARSIWNFRDAKFHDLCEKFGVQHFIEALCVYSDIINLGNERDHDNNIFNPPRNR